MRSGGSTATLRTVRLLRDEPAFTPADKALIHKVHGYMPAQHLLDLLNERLAADRGPDETPHSMEQLYAEIGTTQDVEHVGEHDWSSLRKLVSGAKRSGVLDLVTRQVIDDFAVVFSLSARQVLQLHDVLLKAKEGEDA